MAFDTFVCPRTKNNVDVKFENAIIEFDNIIKKSTLNQTEIYDLNPISVDNNKNYIKILRNLETDIILPKGHINGIYLKFGNGSRGGRGINNKGHKFEHKVQNDLKDSNSKIYKLIDTNLKFSSGDTFIDFIDLSTTNTKRPLRIEKNNVYVNSDVEIFSDLKLQTKFNEHFISIKYGPSVSFFQLGIKKFFNLKNFSHNKEDFSTFCSFFGIDENLFLDSFNSQVYDSFLITDLSTIENYKSFIKSGIGENYWILHGNKKEIEMFFIDSNWLNQFTDFEFIKVFYGGLKGGFKRVSILCQSKISKITLSIRPTDGGKIPTHLTGEYKIF